MNILDNIKGIFTGKGGATAIGEALGGHAGAAKDMIAETPGVIKGFGKLILGITAGVAAVFKYVANALAHAASIPLKFSERFLNSENPLFSVIGGGKAGKFITAATIAVAGLFGIYKLAGTFGEKSKAEAQLSKEEAMSQLIDASAQSRMLDQQAQRLMSGSGYDQPRTWVDRTAGGVRQGTFAEQEAVRAASQPPFGRGNKS